MNKQEAARYYKLTADKNEVDSSQLCFSLTQITFPSSVTLIGNYAFSGCSLLTKIKIPSFVTEIGKK